MNIISYTWNNIEWILLILGMIVFTLLYISFRYKFKIMEKNNTIHFYIKELEKTQVAVVYSNEIIKTIEKYLKEKYGDELEINMRDVNKELTEKIKNFKFDSLNLANAEIK